MRIVSALLLLGLVMLVTGDAAIANEVAEWNTPPIPDYPSTHSVLGGAAAAVLADVLGTDRVTFTMVSGPPFAGISRSFASFSAAAEENADSRVYAGIHFRTACRDGLALGQKIGQRVARMYLLPVRR